MTSSTPVRLGLIGCGRIAQVAHLPAIEKTDQVELTMVCDGNEYTANAVARRYGVPAATTDSAEVFASPDVDAVLIAVPDRFHESLVSQALAAGKHVLIEKPLAATVEECERLVAAAAESGLVADGADTADTQTVQSDDAAPAADDSAAGSEESRDSE